MLPGILLDVSRVLCNTVEPHYALSILSGISHTACHLILLDQPTT